LADISWEKLPADELVSNYAKGQEFDVIILNIDAEKERISLGIKQLDERHVAKCNATVNHRIVLFPPTQYYNVPFTNKRTREPKNNDMYIIYAN
jgi:predicted RNA-binding protein with RPS1 domain